MLDENIYFTSSIKVVEYHLGLEIEVNSPKSKIQNCPLFTADGTEQKVSPKKFGNLKHNLLPSHGDPFTHMQLLHHVWSIIANLSL